MEQSIRSSRELQTEVTQQRASDLSEANYAGTTHNAVQGPQSTATSTTTADQAHPAERPPLHSDPVPSEEDRHANLRSHKRAFDQVHENCELYRAAADGKKVDLVLLHFLLFTRRIIREMDSEHDLVGASTEAMMKMTLDTHRISPQQGTTSDPHRTVISGKGLIHYGLHSIYVRLDPPSDGENPLHVIIALSYVSPKATKSYQSTPLELPKVFTAQQLCEVSLAIPEYETENGLELTGLQCWHGVHDAGVIRPVSNVPNLVLLVRGGVAVKLKGRLQLTELLGQALKHVFNPSSSIDLNVNLTFNDLLANDLHFHAPVHLHQFLVWALWGAPRQAQPIRDYFSQLNKRELLPVSRSNAFANSNLATAPHLGRTCVSYAFAASKHEQDWEFRLKNLADMNARENFDAHLKWRYALEVGNPEEGIQTSGHQAQAYKEYYRQEDAVAPDGFTFKQHPDLLKLLNHFSTLRARVKDWDVVIIVAHDKTPDDTGHGWMQHTLQTVLNRCMYQSGKSARCEKWGFIFLDHRHTPGWRCVAPTHCRSCGISCRRRKQDCRRMGHWHVYQRLVRHL